ncbi:hypothetical protein CHLRE_06g270276v5 [Chlamydomonas reinhardtii]|uniref:Uncharacterized protein n=1 Tax=Chlamydomonas reinhardtii TaxID=3055 RepID=A0A2K3DNA2_CHLRE|nr:uncharacterized protein CHLRE_06g270276v5 [Chlamydomonas reinhardtii]PNW82017.1 hypothetical protein CHLRE_06g270276v5 [Chlamydomonas reinhardtii]
MVSDPATRRLHRTLLAKTARLAEPSCQPLPVWEQSPKSPQTHARVPANVTLVRQRALPELLRRRSTSMSVRSSALL